MKVKLLNNGNFIALQRVDFPVVVEAEQSSPWRVTVDHEKFKDMKGYFPTMEKYSFLNHDGECLYEWEPVPDE